MILVDSCQYGIFLTSFHAICAYDMLTETPYNYKQGNPFIKSGHAKCTQCSGRYHCMHTLIMVILKVNSKTLNYIHNS